MTRLEHSSTALYGSLVPWNSSAPAKAPRSFWRVSPGLHQKDVRRFQKGRIYGHIEIRLNRGGKWKVVGFLEASESLPKARSSTRPENHLESHPELLLNPFCWAYLSMLEQPQHIRHSLKKNPASGHTPAPAAQWELQRQSGSAAWGSDAANQGNDLQTVHKASGGMCQAPPGLLWTFYIFCWEHFFIELTQGDFLRRLGTSWNLLEYVPETSTLQLFV